MNIRPRPGKLAFWTTAVSPNLGPFRKSLFLAVGMLVPAPDVARPWHSQGTPELCPVKPPGKPAFSAYGAAQLHLAQSISRKHTSECWWRLRLTARSACRGCQD